MNRRSIRIALPAALSADHSEVLNRLARGFIERAGRSAPASLSARLEEEWLAELTARSGALARLRFAIGCYWAARVIARQGWAGSPATLVAVHNGRAFAVWFEIHSRTLSRRAVIICFIAALHALMLYALLTGLMITVGSVIPQSLDVSISQEVQQHPQALPPPTPVLSVPKITIPTPEVNVNIPPDPSAIRVPPEPHVAAATQASRGSLKRPDVWVLGGPGRGFPDTDDYYPEMARRLDEAGITTVHVCVDAGGKLTSVPQLARSSGHSMIDQAALRLARAGSGRYRPTTDNGLPVSSCFEYLIRFNLRD